MKYIVPCLLIIMGLIRCTKDTTPQEIAATPNIFNVTTDPNYLLDTVTISSISARETYRGYFFSYDNLNRVTKIKYYGYVYNMPVNLECMLTFNYQANNTNPQTMDLLSTTNNCRVYFFYNTNGSKNRDSVVDLASPSVLAVRKYEYDSAFKYVVAKHYNAGSLKPAFMDSATFTNYNCSTVSSQDIFWIGAVPISYHSYYSEYTRMDNHPNPVSKMNIFPALFFTPYLDPAYSTTGNMWRVNLIMDALFQNNPKRYAHYEYASGAGAPAVQTDTEEGYTYDAKDRLIRKDYVDSVGRIGMAIMDRFTAAYKYR